MRTNELAVFAALLFFPASWASAATLFVDVNSSNPSPPYTNWSNAAASIQDAIDSSTAGDLILVTNGTYRTGGRTVYGSLTNRIVIDKAITLQSVNGPMVTIVEGNSPLGESAVRCAYLTNGATLSGFTLTNGATLTSFNGQNDINRVLYESGGGAWCEGTMAVITNCILINNSAEYGFGGKGGGVYSGALFGCILSGNKAVLGGGAFGSILNDCTLTNNQAFSTISLSGGSAVTRLGGGAMNCALTNCFLLRNSSDGSGGAASSSTLVDCQIEDNSSYLQGGGLNSCTAIRCELSSNSARSSGGGAYAGTLSYCNIRSNSAVFGGGASLSTLNNCKLFYNLALGRGGGADQAKVTASALVGNSAITNGGGAYGGTLNNCTIAGNYAPAGGGTFGSTLTNSIVYFNTAASDSNYSGGVFAYCCTTPMPAGGPGNMAAEPMLADTFHLSAASPCIAAGTMLAALGQDIEGDSWSNQPSIGCDEYQASAASGPLLVAIGQDYANARPGALIQFRAMIEGHSSESRWNFGDGTTVTNQPCITHAWSAPGIYSVNLVTYNSTHPVGVTNSVEVHVLQDPVLFVAQQSSNPQSPFLSWATAATNIQDAIDATFAGGSTVLVSNGVYRTGGRAITGMLTNRINLSKPITVQSVNGPGVTVIEGVRLAGSQTSDQPRFPGYSNGDAAVRCAYVCNGARLDGFTLTNGATRAGYNLSSQIEISGGGAWCESTNAIISNCVIVSNTCNWWGAGVYSGTLKNCQVSSNENFNGSLGGGGGVVFSTVFDSSIQGNRTSLGGGGGALSSTLSNCIVTGNTDVGASNCVLFSSTVSNNNGTGLQGGSANNCTIAGNVSRSINMTMGGGATSTTLSNCILYGNRAANGGGAYNCVMNYCSVSNNYATNLGGGVFWNLASPNPSIGQNNYLANNSAGGHGGGFYATGGTYALTNWTFIGNSAISNGGGFYGASGSRTFYDSTFAGNSAGGSGGGALNATLVRSIVTDNTATLGGGIFNSTVTQCLLEGNHAQIGGAVHNSNNYFVSNCTVVGNSAVINAGGVYGSSPATVLSSIVYFNSAPINSNYSGTVNSYSCLLPMPSSGTGNITNNPALVNFAAGNFRLQTDSPCINEGSGSPGTIDLDGRPRIVGGRIDIGAYEFQGTGISEFIYWLQQNGLATDGSTDYLDPDADQMNNWQEWIAGTKPTNTASCLKLISVTNSASGTTLSWASVVGRSYFLQRASDLGAQSSFSSVQSNIAGLDGFTSFTDNTATNATAHFYRVGVQ